MQSKELQLPTLNEFAAECGWIPPKNKLEEEIQWQKYDQWVDQTARKIRQAFPQGGNSSHLTSILTDAVIRGHLGEAWYYRHVLQAHSSDIAKDYLASEPQVSILRLLAEHRRRELGRRVYEMQSFTWFNDLIEDIRSRNLVGASFELDVLSALMSTSVDVRMRSRTGRKEEDFDISAAIPGVNSNEVVPVEVKAKMDSTPYTLKTVEKTVKHAATQLPKNNKSILFIRIPPVWVSSALEETYHDALYEGTRQTSRIGVILTAIDKPHMKNTHQGRVERFWDLFIHKDCPSTLKRFAELLVKLHDGKFTGFGPSAPF